MGDWLETKQMKLTEKTLKKLIKEAMDDEFIATAPNLRTPDPLDDIFKFIDEVYNAAMEKMGVTDEDLDDWEFSELSNKVVKGVANDIKKVSGDMSNDELLAILRGLMPMLVNELINQHKNPPAEPVDADFSNLNLKGIDLEQSNLSGANFSGADLSIAKKEKYNLPSVLVRVNLKGANFSNANLAGVNFEGAYMKNVNLSGANLKGANMQNAILTGANFDGAVIDDTLLIN